MAREEQDREDLLREATALVQRVELRTPDESQPIVVGFRRQGAAAFFFGADPVYQFNTSGELRRAYVDGKLLKAEQRRLVELTRERTIDAVQLVRRDLDSAETATLLMAMTARLRRLQKALDGEFVELGRVPPECDVVDRVRRELDRLPSPPTIAVTPGVG